MYSLRNDPLNNRFRPYLGLAGGLARVDASSAVSVTDCRNGTPPSVPPTPDCDRMNTMQAVKGTLDAYQKGSSIFFGPTLQTMYAFSNDSAMIFNLNVMLPDVVLEPSIGYVMAL